MATRELKVGDKLGGFQIEKELGRGGMGVVYKAHELSLNRKVALKVLAQRLTFEKEFVERFRREAQIVAQLTHPNVVGILAYGEDDDLHYYAMQYVQGTDLTALLRQKGGISTERALEIAKQVASALEEAHSHGIVHRDLKPQNIMIDSVGRAKVTDFGLARFEGGHSNLTETGVFLGTPEYASPEQASGRPLDIRSDIYAFGAVLYRMFSGRPPVTADTPLAVMAKIMTEPVRPIEEVNPDVPVPVRRLIQGMMAHEAEERFQTPTQVLQAIETCERALKSGEAAVPAAAEAGETIATAVTTRTPSVQEETVVSSPPRPAAAAAPAPRPAAPPAVQPPLVEPPRKTSSSGPLLLVAAAVVLMLLIGGGALWMLTGGDADAPATTGAGAVGEAVADAVPVPVEPAHSEPVSPADAGEGSGDGAMSEDEPAGAPPQPEPAASEPEPVPVSTSAAASQPAPAATRPAKAAAAAPPPETAPALPPVPTVYAAVSGDAQMSAAARAIVEKAIVDAGLELTPMEGRSDLTLLVEIQRTGTRMLTFAGQAQEQVLASYSIQTVDPASGRTVVGPATGDFEYAGMRMKLRLTEALEPAAAQAASDIGAYWQRLRASR